MLYGSDSFVIHIKSFYKDIADDVKKRHDKSKYEVDKPLPKSQAQWKMNQEERL